MGKTKGIVDGADYLWSRCWGGGFIGGQRCWINVSLTPGVSCLFLRGAMAS